jgi:hypothetical protein
MGCAVLLSCDGQQALRQLALRYPSLEALPDE